MKHSFRRASKNLFHHEETRTIGHCVEVCCLSCNWVHVELGDPTRKRGDERPEIQSRTWSDNWLHIVADGINS
jgi:hypothetical protein